jgi:hypothetical protein
MSFRIAVDPAPAGLVNSGRRGGFARRRGRGGWSGEFEASTTQDCSARVRLLHLQEICSKNSRSSCALAARSALFLDFAQSPLSTCGPFAAKSAAVFRCMRQINGALERAPASAPSF